MYGTIFRMRVKPGLTSSALKLVTEWNRNFRPNIKGAISIQLMMTDADPDVLIGVAQFTDRDSYRSAAESPAQDAWYRMFRETLVADPLWEDGEFIVGTA